LRRLVVRDADACVELVERDCLALVHVQLT
jgi:hypothetical protein